MFAGSFIGKLLGTSTNRLINYRELTSVRDIIIICDMDDREIAKILPYLRKNDLIITTDDFRYLSEIFSDLQFKFFKESKDGRQMIDGINPLNRIFVNLHREVLSIGDTSKFTFRVGRFASHKFPEYNILIRGNDTEVLFKILRRKQRKRIPMKIGESNRKKIKIYYKGLKKKGYQKIIYLKKSQDTSGFNENIFHVVETKQRIDYPNTLNVQPKSLDSIIYSYYADEFVGPAGLQSLLRKSRK